MKYPDDLTPREMETIGYLVRGIASKIIAAEMNISINTYYANKRSIYIKTGTHTVQELVWYARRIGFNEDGIYTAIKGA